MFSFRQKIFLSSSIAFFIFIILLFPFISQWVHHIVIRSMEDRVTEIIKNIKDAPNNEALIRRLKDQKSLVFFRVSVISHEHKLLYDSHVKRILGPKFTQEYIVDHPEVLEAFRVGVGFKEDYSQLLKQKFAYFAKAFNFHGRVYVLRTAFPHQYVNDITHNFEVGFLVFATSILLLFGLMIWFIIHHLTKPIQKILQTVKPYQEGLQPALPEIDTSLLNPRDDFTKLAMTLNILSAKVKVHIDTITNERNEKEAILESLVEGVIAVDENLVITYANHMANKQINPSQIDLVGKNFAVLEQKQCFELLQKCQKEHKPLTDTLEIYQNGKKIYLDIVAASKKDNRGAIIVFQDKTAHYKIFEMRRDFVANASHELKTPITIIRGFAEALHDNPGLGRDVQEKITEKIMRNCKRMTSLIKDLLTLADIENIPSSRLSECNLQELAERCVSMVLEIFPDADIKIDKLKERVRLVADEDLLELAIMNLIENAAKYSARPANIHIALDDYVDYVEIKISDKGLGIPVIDQEHIFDRFYTVDKAHSQKMGGSGLGLSIVKTIVEKHFGTVCLESELGQGSTFIINLPKVKYNFEE